MQLLTTTFSFIDLPIKQQGVVPPVLRISCQAATKDGFQVLAGGENLHSQKNWLIHHVNGSSFKNFRLECLTGVERHFQKQVSGTVYRFSHLKWACRERGCDASVTRYIARDLKPDIVSSAYFRTAFQLDDVGVDNVVI